MKDALLCRYFTDTPGWQRQLAQLRKKCLAGYADGVICLRDASKEECCAAEGLLGRHFVPPQLRYNMSDFEKALQSSRFSVINMADFWQRLDVIPLRPNQQQKADYLAEVHSFFAAESVLSHGAAANSWLLAMEQERKHGF